MHNDHSNSVRLDLHCHTTWSSGFTSPIGLAHQASLSDIPILAITDHHTTAGYREASEEAHAVGVTLIPAIELDCWYEGRRADLLGYWIDPDHPRLTALLQRWPSGIGQLLSDDLFYRSLNTLLPSPLTPANIKSVPSSEAQTLFMLMRLLVQHGFAPTLGQAFQRFHNLQQAGILERTPHHYVSVEEATQTLRAAGGIVTLAHPALIRNDDIVRNLVDSGLIDALEAPYTSYWTDKDAKNQRYAALAEETGLARTAGSDYHAYPHSTTQLGVDVEEALWNTLLNLKRVRYSR